MSGKKRVMVRRYADKGPWHLVRDDAHTVCGRPPDRTLHQQRATVLPKRLEGDIYSVNRLCSSCDRMKDADSIRLAK